MATQCRFDSKRILDIDFYQNEDCKNLGMDNHYRIVLLEKGNVNLEINKIATLFVAPCAVLLSENMDITFVSSYMLKAQSVRFGVGFLNLNITYDFINSGEYEKNYEEYGLVALEAFYKRSGKYFGFLPLSDSIFQRVTTLFSKINKAITKQRDTRWSCRGRMYLELLIELLHQTYKAYNNSNLETYDSKDPNVWVAMILEKIHKFDETNISLATLSKFVGINRNTVAICFRQVTGYSVTDYILHYRLKRACQLLATTDIKVQELSKVCGFSREAYFIRQFKAKIGITPNKYRKQIVEKRKNAFGAKI